MTLPELVILSKGRAEIVETQHLFPKDLVKCVVPHNEYAAYRSANPHMEIISLPAGIVGEARTRQWIYEQWPDVIQLDDDLLTAHNVENLRKHPSKKGGWIGSVDLGPEDLCAHLERLRGEAEDLGAYLYGTSTRPPNPANYTVHQPIRITGFVLGGVVGLRPGSKIFFNPKIVAAADYWASGVNAYYHRKCLVDYRLVVWDDAGTFSAPGGQQIHRTLETEAEDTRLLMEAFGTDAIRHKGSNTRSSQTGFASQRTFQTPF